MSIKPAVVTVGDELIFGERSNDNQAWMLRLFWERGVPPEIAVSLPDKAAVIALWLRRLLDENHFPIFVSGGIGGTHDDRTRDGIAMALNVPLTRHEECFAFLSARYGDRFNLQRQRMAWLPEGCELIPNPIGAPGFHLQGIFAFPGFPNMLQPMALEVLSRIAPHGKEVPWITREVVLPVAEGDIAADVEAFAAHFPEAHMGIYPAADKRNEVTLRLRCPSNHPGTAEAFSQLAEQLRRKIAP